MRLEGDRVEDLRHLDQFDVAIVSGHTQELEVKRKFSLTGQFTITVALDALQLSFSVA